MWWKTKKQDIIVNTPYGITPTSCDFVQLSPPTLPPTFSVLAKLRVERDRLQRQMDEIELEIHEIQSILELVMYTKDTYGRQRKEIVERLEMYEIQVAKTSSPMLQVMIQDKLPRLLADLQQNIQIHEEKAQRLETHLHSLRQEHQKLESKVTSIRSDIVSHLGSQIA